MSRLFYALCASAIALSGCADEPMASGYGAPFSPPPAPVDPRPVAPPAATNASLSRSIRDFTACDGRTDDAKGVQAAFQAAAHNAFTLVVDCPVMLHVGDDIARPIFVDSGTRVVFTGSGRLTVDNSGIPAFVIANSNDIHFLGWRILYTGQTPLAYLSDGYHRDGQWIPQKTLISATFNNTILTPWMAKSRNVAMTSGHDLWNGPTNSCAIFFFAGDDNGVEVRNMTVSVPDFGSPSRYVPMVFSFTTGFYSGTVTTKAGASAIARPAVPRNIVFDQIDFDGTLMGIQGTMVNATFSHVRSHHYADLQGDDGSDPGGQGKWFAPPHLFYINGGGVNTVQPQHIRISDVVDDGIRVGRARDTQGNSGSGNALSLKIGGDDVIVDGYISHRPDGFLDVLTANGLTIRNAQATYDSGFLNNIYPGIRFPAVSPQVYKNVTLENITLTDTSPQTIRLPIGISPLPGNSNIIFRNIRVNLNAWVNKAPLTSPVAGGTGNSTPVSYFTNVPSHP